jgi:hypothetical protein
MGKQVWAQRPWRRSRGGVGIGVLPGEGLSIKTWGRRMGKKFFPLFIGREDGGNEEQFCPPMIL